MSKKHKVEFNHNEVKIGNCVFAKKDILMMYVDAGESIEGLAKRLGVGVFLSKRILNYFDIPTSWKGEITPRRLRILRYIRYHQRKHKKAPNLSQIGRAVGIPPSCVYFHIQNLKKLGYVEKTKKISLTQKGKEVCGDANTFNIFSMGKHGKKGKPKNQGRKRK